MAGNEATSQTELWSSVVHQPCEEPEESELPSTVDMAAFTTGLSVEPTNTSQNNDNSDSDSDSELESSNSGSEACQSSSQTDSSDSDSSTSSLESSSRSPSPEFSVTSSQTNGLRLTIATVRKSSGTPPIDKMSKNVDGKLTKSGDCSSSSETVCSSDSESDSEASAAGKIPVSKSNVKSAKDTVKKSVVKVRTKVVEKKDDKKNAKKEGSVSPTKGANCRLRTRQKKTKKVSVSNKAVCAN